MLRRLAAVMLVPLVVCTATAAAWAAPATLLALAPVIVQTVSGTQIAALTDKIAFGLVHDVDRTVVPAYRVADQTVPLGRVEITPLTPLVYATYVAVPLQIAVNGRVAKTITAGYRVQQYVHTAVAAHDLAPGALLAAADLAVARVLSNGRPTVDVAVLIGRKIRAATARGAQIFVEQTAINELVKAGSGAILVVHDGPVALTADVIARTGGGLGESVTVYNAQTNRILSGTVTGPDRVELVLPGGDESE
jgi:flagella basal body P-ring formation protein FlgA